MDILGRGRELRGFDWGRLFQPYGSDRGRATSFAEEIVGMALYGRGVAR
jgi:hypothetical protein